MKFYIISIIINIALMLIPFTTPIMKDSEIKEVEKIVKINLKFSIFENVSAENNSTIQQNLNKSDLKQEIDLQTQKVEMKKYNEEKLQQKDTIQQDNGQKLEIKKDNEEDSRIVEEKRRTINSSSNQSLNNNSNTSYNENNGKNFNNESKNNVTKMDNNSSGIEKRNENSSGGNVCREGIDFNVVYNPNLPYPIAAQRLGMSKEVLVNVRITINRNGSVNVSSISGGNQVFQNEARKAAQKIKIKIKNSETLKCTLTKPFRFRASG